MGLLIPFPAYSADGCGFGFSEDVLNWNISEEDDPPCVESKWDIVKKNDGFTNFVSLVMYPDEEGPSASSDEDSYIQIYCIKKAIQVYVWVEYADSFGFDGSGQYRIDNGKPITFKYTLQKDLDGVVLKSPKTFMTAFAKAKERVTFKIPNVDGYEIVVYPKADLLNHRGLFASKGCKF